MSNRAQIALTDLIFALVIFFILLVAFFTTWQRLNSRLADTLTFNELELLTLQIADLLTSSPGVPNDWENNPQTIHALGLAATDRILTPNKVTALAQLPYNTTQALFNVERFDLYILLKQNNQAILEIGNIPTKRAVQIRRLVRYEGTKATLDVALWKN